MPITTVDGLVSGTKTTAIVDAMIQADRASTAVLEARQQVFSTRLEAVRTYNTKLLSAQLDSVELKRASNFQARKATSSNSAAADATATNSAVAGTYRLNVVSVAQAHQIRTAGKQSASVTNGTGDVTLRLGNGAATTISPTDTSLNGLAAAINAANVGITASVINDGSADVDGPNKLVLQSNQTGAANTISISGTGDLTTLFASANLTTLSGAADAEIRLGGNGVGDSPITIKKSSNSITDVIPGVTLNLKGTDSNLTVTVASDPTQAKTTIKTFVDSLNASIKYLKENTGFDPDTKVAGTLQSDTNLRNGADAVLRALTGVVPGLPSALNNLSAIGVTIDRQKGTLVIDDATLDAKLAADPTGVEKLFTNSATSTSNSISFAALSDKTVVTSPFTVNITAAATRATAVTTGDLAASTVIDGTNNGLNLTFNGRALTVTLASGTYTRAQLAEQVQNAINAASTDNGSRVIGSLNGNALDLRTERFGSAQSLNITGGTAQAALNLSLGTTLGSDVRGTINGGATLIGNGQVLSGADGTAAEGLRLVVTATTGEVGGGLSATVTARKGIGQLANEKLIQLTNVDSGSVTQRQTALQKTIDSMSDQIAKTDARLAERRSRYLAKFRLMEELTQKYQSLGSFITNQLNAQTNAAAANR